MKQINFVKLMRSKLNTNHYDYKAMIHLCELIAEKCKSCNDHICVCDANDDIFKDLLEKDNLYRPTWHHSIHVPTLFCYLWDSGILNPNERHDIDIECYVSALDNCLYPDRGKLKIYL